MNFKSMNASFTDHCFSGIAHKNLRCFFFYDKSVKRVSFYSKSVKRVSFYSKSVKRVPFHGRSVERVSFFTRRTVNIVKRVAFFPCPRSMFRV